MGLSVDLTVTGRVVAGFEATRGDVVAGDPYIR